MLNTTEAKRKFAEYLALGMEPYDAGLKLFGEDITSVLTVALQWPTDPEVLSYKNTAFDENPELGLPSRREIKQQLLDRMARRDVSPKDYAQLMKLYCEISGYIEKPGDSSNGLVNTRLPDFNITFGEKPSE